MNIKQTRTFSVLEISRSAYQEIKSKLIEAGYEHAIMKEGERELSDLRGEKELIDMHGIAVTESADSRETDHLLRQALAEYLHASDVSKTVEYLDAIEKKYKILEARLAVGSKQVQETFQDAVINDPDMTAEQIVEEGFTAEHDRRNDDGQLLLAGVSYLIATLREGHHVILMPEEKFAGDPEFWWPWNKESWKPKDRIRNLARAGALIAAETDRLRHLEQR